MQYKFAMQGEPKTEDRPMDGGKCPVCQCSMVVSSGFEPGRHWTRICPEEGCNFFEVGVFHQMIFPTDEDELGGVKMIPWTSGHVQVIEGDVSCAPGGDVLVIGREKACVLGDAFEASWQPFHPRPE